MDLHERHELQTVIQENKLLKAQILFYRGMIEEMRTIIDDLTAQGELQPRPSD